MPSYRIERCVVRMRLAKPGPYAAGLPPPRPRHAVEAVERRHRISQQDDGGSVAKARQSVDARADRVNDERLERHPLFPESKLIQHGLVDFVLSSDRFRMFRESPLMATKSKSPLRQ